MPAKLISKFASSMGASQSNQITALLQEGAEGGSFETGSDFQSHLQILSELVSTNRVPIFTFFQVAALEVVDNSRINHPLRYVQLDMETVYSELNTIQDAIAGHATLMNQNIIDVKNSLATLDTRISTLEMLSFEYEYNLAQFNTFNMLGSQTLPRTAPEAASLYTDDRLSTVMGISTELELDIHKEGLVLPNVATQVPIVGIELLEGAGTTVSHLDVDPVDNSLDHVLVDGDSKYWVRSVLLLDQDPYHQHTPPPPEGVSAIIRILLGGFQSVNNIILTPFTSTNMKIEQISYHAASAPAGTFYDLLAGAVTITETASMLFDSIQTDEILIKINQVSYAELSDFFYGQAPADQALAASMTALGSESGITIGAATSTTVEYSKGYFYSMWFDFIGINDVDYSAQGIYVSQPLISTTPVVEVALRSGIRHSENSLGQQMDTVEFRIIKYNYDNSSPASLLYVEDIPIKTGAGLNNVPSSIIHEALLPNSSGVGILRIFPKLDTPGGGANTLKVYRDFTLLTLGTDYKISWDNGGTFASSVVALVASSGSPSTPYPRLYIQILGFSNTSNYTATYDVQTGVSANAINTATMKDSSVSFSPRPDLEDQLSHSHIFLKIIVRSFDLLSTRSTPAILDYTLVARETVI